MRWALSNQLSPLLDGGYLEETIDIIDDVPSEGLERVQGGKVVRTSLRYALARALLRNEIRDWVADRLMPKTAP